MALDVDRIDVDGVWYRHLPHRGSVWWRSEPPPDGRWQRGSVAAGFYLADSRETAWAEWYRQIDELALRPTDQLPRDLWRFEIGAEGIADLRSEAQLARVGLAVPLPRRHGWPTFQEVGEQLYAQGWKGVRAPSAARPGSGEILCLFREGEKLDGVKPAHRPPSSEIRHPGLLPDADSWREPAGPSPLRRGSTTVNRPCPNTATGIRTPVSGLRIGSVKPFAVALVQLSPGSSILFACVRWSRGRISGQSLPGATENVERAM